MDLLGYGAMISEAEFNPLHPKASEAMKRLRRFHKIVSAHSSRHFPTLVMNDGAVAYRDLSFRTRSPTYDFVMRAWQLFEGVRSQEEHWGLPGARMVVATGFRMRGGRRGMDAVAGHFGSLMQRYKNRQITAEQAIAEAAKIRPRFDIVPQLQANFAFSKAYVAERSGTKGGLAGANFFIDLALFDDPLPQWIVTEKIVRWSDETLGMKASFAHVLGFPTHESEQGGQLGIRDGLQVAQYLAGDPDVLKKLRAAGKPSPHDHATFRTTSGARPRRRGDKPEPPKWP